MSSRLTPASYSSSSRAGITFHVGMGRVISLVMMAIFSPGCTMSRSWGVPMGSFSARRTSASPVSATDTSLGVRMPCRFASGTCTVSLRVPIFRVMSINEALLCFYL